MVSSQGVSNLYLFATYSVILALANLLADRGCRGRVSWALEGTVVKYFRKDEDDVGMSSPHLFFRIFWVFFVWSFFGLTWGRYLLNLLKVF